jgi:hypothetical protein
LALFLEVVGLRCLEMWRRSAPRSRDWLVDAATIISSRAPARDFPYVLGMQLTALFVMESSEQILLGGKLAGGTAWLGGPVAFSLLTHALIGFGCVLLLQWCMRAIQATFASLVSGAIESFLIARARKAPGAFLWGRGEPHYWRAQAPHVRQIGGRAPPLLQTAI